jgi:ubiquinone/menaquinone biosynthesis C-methylase UbiE
MDTSEEQRREQIEAWGRVAAGWDRHWPVFEAAAQKLSDRLVELAGVETGQRVLDLATGIGEPALTAARRVGPRGRVVAVDQTPAMISLARRRAADAGLANLDFAEATAESFDGGKTSFDAVLCRWGLMLFVDPDRALDRARGLLRPGGRLAAAVWSEPENVPLLRILDEAIREAVDPPPPPPGSPGPFSMADEGALRDRVGRAGFEAVITERLTCRFTFDSPAAFRAFEEDVSMSLGALQEGPPERIEAARRVLEEGAARHADETGRVILPCEAVVVSARRPA